MLLVRPVAIPLHLFLRHVNDLLNLRNRDGGLEKYVYIARLLKPIKKCLRAN